MNITIVSKSQSEYCKVVFYDCRNSISNLRVLDCASAHLIHTRLFDHRKRLLDKSQIVTTFTELRYLKEPGHDFR